MPACSVDDCVKTSDRRGMCSAHYQRFKRHGDPLAGGLMRVKGSPQEILNAFTERRGGHLIWTGARNGKYGRVTIEGKRLYVHRLAWILKHGEPPPDAEVDHDPSCPKLCVDVDHLSLMKDASEHLKISWQRGEVTGGWPHRRKTRLDPVTGRFISNASL